MRNVLMTVNVLLDLRAQQENHESQVMRFLKLMNKQRWTESAQLAILSHSVIRCSLSMDILSTLNASISEKRTRGEEESSMRFNLKIYPLVAMKIWVTLLL
jgi:hypothetical protein